MGDILKGFSGKWTYIVGWTLASGLGVSAFVLIVGQRLIELNYIPDYSHYDGTTKTLLFVAVASFLGFLLGTVSTPVLYRPLEGYYWFPFREKRTQHYRKKKSELLAKHEYAAREAYPVDDDDVMPSRFGNAMRAMETYSYDRYTFDTIRLWPPARVGSKVASRRT